METNLLTLLVKDAVQLEPRRDSLHKLLKLAQWDVTDASLDNRDDRTSALNTLKRYLDPNERCDGSSNDESDEILLDMIKQVEVFYQLCCKNLQTLPSEFHVEDKWPYLQETSHVKPPEGSSTPYAEALTDNCLAYTCLNYLGAIAHGRVTGLVFDLDSYCGKAITVQEVFQKKIEAPGPIRQLNSVFAAKKVIMEEGPIVSTSFRLTEAVAARYPNCFASVVEAIVHPVLIVGWKSTPLGQQWLIRTHRATSDLAIPMGHFSIDENMIAPPAGCMDHEEWQEHELIWDRDDLDPKPQWFAGMYTESTVGTKDFMKLAGLLECGFGTAINNKTQFLVRDKTKIGRSRCAYLTEVAWLEEKQQWKVNLNFVSELQAD